MRYCCQGFVFGAAPRLTLFGAAPRLTLLMPVWRIGGLHE